ncbi:MAG TPA: hypothetical protein VF624_18535, partial [Tepidisphaeraceae bacterium]
MLRRPCSTITVLLLTTCAVAAPLDADAIETLAAKGEWPAVLRETSRAIGLRGKAAAGYDRSRMWELRGEAQLRTNQFKPAAESFKNAAAEPGVPQARADACLAAARLMPRTEARGYDPPLLRGQTETPLIEVLTDAGRRRAAAAFLDDALSEIDAKLDKAKSVRLVRVAASCVEDNTALRP